ncbi:MAG TPA: sugar phosphate isomerase/epimerase family protein [Capillimicrobium sp.]|nr:sugar phosphate isomerase/epimerase family protein [Capillimicrobium sp.]
MRIGVDSYSYHRLLGEVRPGERAPERTLAGAEALVAEMVDAGAEVLSLETVFLDPPVRLDVDALVAAARGRELAVAWGHPYGLRWGADPAALADLLAWIDVAPRLGARIVRCVAAHPALRDGPVAQGRLDATALALSRARERARARGVVLALENHADLDGAELLALLDAVPGLRVCLDTANALRVGDDPVALAAAVADRVAIVHLKDLAGMGPDPRSVPYGTGIVDLVGVLDALEAGGAPADVPVCVELAQLGPGAVDERLLVRQGIGWLAAQRRARFPLDTATTAQVSCPETVPVAIPAQLHTEEET